MAVQKSSRQAEFFSFLLPCYWIWWFFYSIFSSGTLSAGFLGRILAKVFGFLVVSFQILADIFTGAAFFCFDFHMIPYSIASEIVSDVEHIFCSGCLKWSELITLFPHPGHTTTSRGFRFRVLLDFVCETGSNCWCLSCRFRSPTTNVCC